MHRTAFCLMRLCTLHGGGRYTSPLTSTRLSALRVARFSSSPRQRWPITHTSHASRLSTTSVRHVIGLCPTGIRVVVQVRMEAQAAEKLPANLKKIVGAFQMVGSSSLSAVWSLNMRFLRFRIQWRVTNSCCSLLRNWILCLSKIRQKRIASTVVFRK